MISSPGTRGRMGSTCCVDAAASVFPAPGYRLSIFRAVPVKDWIKDCRLPAPMKSELNILDMGENIASVAQCTHPAGGKRTLALPKRGVGILAQSVMLGYYYMRPCVRSTTTTRSTRPLFGTQVSRFSRLCGTSTVAGTHIVSPAARAHRQVTIY